MDKKPVNDSFYDSFSLSIAKSVSLIIYFGAVLTLSLITETNIFLVFFSTIPVFLFILSLFYMIKNSVDEFLLWVMPLIFPSVFLLLWYSKIFITLSNIDGPMITLLNIVISYIINIIVLLIIGLNKKITRRNIDSQKYKIREIPEKNDFSIIKNKDQHLKNENYINAFTKKDFKKRLRTIEDKCKAINFVIGRVYSNKNGGSEEIRAKLRIPSELYNKFSEISKKNYNVHELEEVLKKIIEKLLNLETEEKLLFDSGSDNRIIDILSKNDSDPIVEYLQETKEICEDILKNINSRKIKDFL
ncbi:MAG: hypothetical protein QXK76_00255 [Candidatus Woesearchaeota archaeon]